MLGGGRYSWEAERCMAAHGAGCHLEGCSSVTCQESCLDDTHWGGVIIAAVSAGWQQSLQGYNCYNVIHYIRGEGVTVPLKVVKQFAWFLVSAIGKGDPKTLGWVTLHGILVTALQQTQ